MRLLATVNRNITDRTFTLPLEVCVQCKHLLRRALFVTAGERHGDRFEIESRRLDVVQIFNRSVVGVDSEIVPGVDQAGSVQDGADVGFAVFGFESFKTAQLRQSGFPTSLDALELFLMNLVFSRPTESSA